MKPPLLPPAVLHPSHPPLHHAPLGSVLPFRSLHSRLCAVAWSVDSRESDPSPAPAVTCSPALTLRVVPPPPLCQVDDTIVSKHFLTEFALGPKPVVWIQIHLKAFPEDRESCAQREGQAAVIQEQVAVVLSCAGYCLLTRWLCVILKLSCPPPPPPPPPPTHTHTHTHTHKAFGSGGTSDTPAPRSLAATNDTMLGVCYPHEQAVMALKSGKEVIIAGDFNDYSSSVPDADGNMPRSQVLRMLQVPFHPGLSLSHRAAMRITAGVARIVSTVD